MREMQVQFLGWKDPLEKEMATHSSILAWRIPWTEEPGGPQSTEEPDTTEHSTAAVLGRFPGCAGSPLLRASFLRSWRAEIALDCGARASRRDGSSCGARALEHAGVCSCVTWAL